MKLHKSLFFTLAVIGTVEGLASPSASPAPGAQAFLTTLQTWEDYRENLQNNPDAMERLRQAVEACLSVGRFSVIDKKRIPPGGTPNDYSSQAPYWWPDPEKADGLPYIRRDGKTNPEYRDTDHTTMRAMMRAVSSSIHFVWLDSSPGRQRHAEQAARLLRAWFLDAETRMNPHLRFAQRIPGRVEGRGIGIIDTTTFCPLLDEISHFERMVDAAGWRDVWTSGDRASLRKWFSDYLDWLLTSDNGRDECGARNNHGTWFDAQVATFAWFCGRPDLARRQIDTYSRNRISSQIMADGSQPHELVRTRSLGYSVFNLTAFVILARVDACVSRPGDTDAAGPLPLWKWKSEAGGGIVEALDCLLPYLQGERPWPYPQISPYSTYEAAWLYHLAGQETGETRYTDAAEQLAREPWDTVSRFGAGVKRK